MKYVPFITHISKEDVAFEVFIMNEHENLPVGFGSVIYCGKDLNHLDLEESEYFLPSEYHIDKEKIRDTCLKFLRTEVDVEKMVV